jgi:hypothetical protein
MADTLLTMARELQLYSPGVPILLAQRWIRDRYRLAVSRWLWSFEIGASNFTTPPVYQTGSITLTLNSNIIQGSGTGFGAQHVGLQLKVGGFVYTITSVVDVTHLTIDQVWGSPTQSGQAYQIVQAYITPTPADFHSFISVIDPALSWRIRLHYSYLDLDRIDTRRSSTGTPILLAARNYNADGVPQYEFWPHSVSQKQYMYLYEKRVTDLVNGSDSPPNPIEGDALVWGAIADLCRWPGTETYNNKMFNIQLAMEYEKKFENRLNTLNTIDQNVYLTDLVPYTELPWAPLDAKFIQNHAFVY